MSKWTKEELLREAAGIESHGYVAAPAMLREYAALQSVRPVAEIDIELEREIFDLCKQFADPYPSWVVKHIAWLRHVFASRRAPTKD